MECKWGIWMNPEKLEYDFTFTFWWSDEEKIQAVNGSHVVQAHPVVVKTYKLYIHTIQFCTQEVRLPWGTSRKYPWIYHGKEQSPNCDYRSNKKVYILKYSNSKRCWAWESINRWKSSSCKSLRSRKQFISNCPTAKKNKMMQDGVANMNQKWMQCLDQLRTSIMT